MICKIFRRGKGRASGVDYLMSPTDASGVPRNPPAELIKGDVTVTKKLIAGNSYVQKYTSGVLSWSEGPNSISDKQIEQVIESFQNMVCAGLPNERINWLWVKHQDKGRLELHFVIPNIDLLTGKRFAPYFDRADRPLFRAWERLTNATHGFTNPADPALKRSATMPPFIPTDKQQALELINGRLSFLVRAGHIVCRADVLNELQSAGYEINRAGKDYISIKDKSNKKLRLRGALFAEDLQLPAKSHASPGSLYDLGALQTEFNTQLEKRHRYTSVRYVAPLDAYSDIKPINFISIKESINEGNTTLSASINAKSRESANEAISKLARAARSLGATIELFLSCANQFIDRVRNLRPHQSDISS